MYRNAKTICQPDALLLRTYGHGLKFLRAQAEHIGKETTSLRTSGFEIVFPSMLNEAKVIGFDLPYGIPCWTEIFALREKKIKRIPVEMMHSVHTTMLYSLEALQEVVQWKRILKLQSRDGSFLSSPSATAAAYMNSGDAKCLEFLTYIIRRFQEYAPCQYPFDLLERIWAVDTIQRLGIDHYFKDEISDTINYVHMNIGEKGVSWGRDNPIPDVDDTCMALRLARLHGLPVSSEVLENFKDENGAFICFPGETHRGISDMFNLYRFSQISFPGEEILEVARPIIEQYLQKCVDNNQMDDKWSLKKALDKEVARALRYPWNMSLQKLEAREYINHYGENDVWIAKTIYRLYNVNNPKYLELAKLDYNRLQPMYKREIKSILKWWTGCGLNDPFVTRVHPKAAHLAIAATLSDPEFKECRIAYIKSTSIEDVLEDLFHKHDSISDLKLLSQAVKQWNPSLVSSLGLKVKVIFMGMYDTLNELAIQASNAQGRDVFPRLHELRMGRIQYYLKHREIREIKHFVSWNEYTENGKKDHGVAIRLLPAMFLMGEILPDNFLQSKMHEQLSLYLRLLTDVRKYENMMGAETTSPIHSYINEANCTEEEAISHVKKMTEDAFHELLKEYLKPRDYPHCRRLMFEHGRITRFFLGDNISSLLAQREKINDDLERLLSPV
ncbi:uncharacterized protein A4U43_C05F7820 [Asparagus officinalis]|uniref:Terpene synthase N-terminal domain-containing protein n=1 Tax=Asparagus officinalis TaxID=4686 RepID=A0A5P1EQC4_ASPOF|nr:uncharacterized protein A4U43_C05F7820 [Asparagus officinalis]